jgi:hypothetical protein
VKLTMVCACGARLPIRATGFSGCASTRRCACGRRFDYSCWAISSKDGVTVHKLEASEKA